MRTAKVGETWKDPTGVIYLIIAADPANNKVNMVGTGWVSDHLEAQGWTQQAPAPADLEQRISVLEALP